MGKSFLTGCFSMMVIPVVFIAGCILFGWKIGLVAALGAFVLLVGLIFYFLITAKGISWLDICLPVPVAIFFSILWFPIQFFLEFGTNLFSIPACIGSAILLSMSLFWVKEKHMPRAWLAIPLASFIYEILPVDIPGPVDEYVAFGGSLVSIIWQGMRYRLLEKPASESITAESER
jgi:hypothetical protein